IMLLAPVVRGRKGQHKDVFRQIIKAGFVRGRIDGAFAELNSVPELDAQKYHNIEVIVDRLILKEGIENRLFESLKLAIKMGEGFVNCIYEKERIVTEAGTTRSVWKDLMFSTRYCCPKCKMNYLELEPRTFSFNSPYGICPTCQGTGQQEDFDPDLIVPDLSCSWDDGALVPWKKLSAAIRRKYQPLIDEFLTQHNLDTRTPLADWPDELRKLFFLGNEIPVSGLALTASAGRQASDSSVAGESAGTETTEKTFIGIIPLLKKIQTTTRSEKERKLLESFQGTFVCRDCQGARIRIESRMVTLNDKKIHELTALSVEEMLRWFRAQEFPPEQKPVAEPLVRQIIERLDFMNRVGLNYLTLDRASDSLSGGERQRVRLATGLGNGLVGVCYILDEPSIGLHPRDNRRLIEAIRQLQYQGNTIIVVEHDEAVMREADWLIDIGPGAGPNGGQVLAEGIPETIIKEAKSLTGQYLSGQKAIPVPRQRRKIVKSKSLVIEGVTTNNLKNVTATFPLGTFICVTGVSGSGKSSLLNETLVPALMQRLYKTKTRPGLYKSLRGVTQIDKLIKIDQMPIGRSPRSNPATYTGVFDEIRKVFAASRDAKRLGFKAGRFSFNIAGGRCEKCQGQGIRKIEMHFLPDMYSVCPECEGKRFNRQTLEIKYKDKSIADVLDMSVDDAILFFENYPTIIRLLEGLNKVGLGYLTLGQASTTLSGGEAQRIKLATELSRVDTGKTLYVLDEPTCGLHANDIQKLLEVLSNLVDLGNTVIVIEHNLDVIKTADWVIDLGPEGGVAGGEIIACGTPEQIARLENNDTGRFLREVLKNS
ncbi:MAG: excinuclease ABC subunit UvrA, partial [Thermoguttaceae bacterium]|nr:excinuclease ABC subunit UvrA [Thermoguttaceae bacterium]